MYRICIFVEVDTFYHSRNSLTKDLRFFDFQLFWSKRFAFSLLPWELTFGLTKETCVFLKSQGAERSVAWLIVEYDSSVVKWNCFYFRDCFILIFYFMIIFE